MKSGNHAESSGINKPKGGGKKGWGSFSCRRNIMGRSLRCFHTSYVSLTEKMRTHLPGQCGPWFVPGAMSRRGDGSRESLRFGN